MCPHTPLTSLLHTLTSTCLAAVSPGRLDDTRPHRIESGRYDDRNGEALRAALDAMLAGKKPSADQKPSMGCNIKWKIGNEPVYFG